MSFMVGFVQGLKDMSEERARKEELQQAKEERQFERDLRAKEREEDKAFERQMFREKLLESRRDVLYGELLKKRESQKEATKYAEKAQRLASRFEGIDDPRVSAITANPIAAAQLEDKIDELQRARAKEDLPPLAGPVLLEYITVPTQSGEYKLVDIDMDDIANLDLSDPAKFQETLYDLTRTQPVPDIAISSEAYRMPKPETLKPGQEAFDAEVNRLANQTLESLKGNTEEWSKLSGVVEGARKGSGPDLIALREMFGSQAYGSLAAMNNPYLSGIEQDPQLFRYRRIWEISNILNDPNITPEEKARAEGLLRRLQGGV